MVAVVCFLLFLRDPRLLSECERHRFVAGSGFPRDGRTRARGKTAQERSLSSVGLSKRLVVNGSVPGRRSGLRSCDRTLGKAGGSTARTRGWRAPLLTASGM